MNVGILNIGDELLQGQINNTNASFIAEKLTEAGISIGWMTTVGDRREVILDSFAHAQSRARAVIITGGLGPTPDDLTKSCLAEFFSDKIIFREDLLEHVEARFSARGLEMPETSRNQAEFPQCALVIPNPNGTAAGIHYSRGGVEWFALPGIPSEMRAMMQDYVLPRLLEMGLGEQLGLRMLRTTGIGESFLMQKMTRLTDAALLVEVAFLPRIFGVDIKLTARGGSPGDIERRLDQAESLLIPDLELYLYGRGEETLPEVVGKVAKERGLRLAVAESCTGGLIAKWLTDVSGSSDFFERGIVCYSNDAKTELLGVPPKLILDHGAVSAEVAQAMAEGLLARSPVHLAVSVTGIAGPTGGTPEKPVGLTYIAVVSQGSAAQTFKFQFGQSRDQNRKRAAAAVLKLLHDQMIGYPLP
ncbi:MAG TPA: competence/damage-inducible protein A [bacterium]|jgi:nicotinamide-nucleotide amidase